MRHLKVLAARQYMLGYITLEQFETLIAYLVAADA